MDEHILLVEDDLGDTFLVQELLRDAEEDFSIVCVRSLAEAASHVRLSTLCILLDLELPDATGLFGLTELLRLAPHAAVVVLTGLADRQRGVEAVAAGAQDYLVKGEIDGQLLGRSIRYAVERKRADDTARKLYEADVRREHNLRLQRGLVAHPLLRDPAFTWVSRYRPRGGDRLLGGDFFDAVELADGRLRMMIGDVAGHGPDEAALGVSLRIGWRTLVLAGQPEEDILPTLTDVLSSERHSDEIFATVCDVSVAADRSWAWLRLAGHPPPLFLEPITKPLSDELQGPPLGVVSRAEWHSIPVELGPRWSLLLYTDGLIEGRTAPMAGTRLGVEGLAAIASAAYRQDVDPPDFVDSLIAEAEALHGGPLSDDVALFFLSYAPSRRS